MDSSDSLSRAFGAVLARLRQEHSMSQEALSFEVELTRTHISLLERGKHSPTLNTMHVIAGQFGLPLDQLILMVLHEHALLRANATDDQP